MLGHRVSGFGLATRFACTRLCKSLKHVDAAILDASVLLYSG